jgi:putative transposase
MKPRTGSHGVFSVRLHFVFVTHYRRKVITAPMMERLGEMIGQVSNKMDCALIQFSGEYVP